MRHRLDREQMRRVADIWEELDDGDASQPTERLFALVCDQASSELGREVDDGDVADALAERNGPKVAP